VNFNSGEAEANQVVAQIVAHRGRAVAIPADVSLDEDVVRMFKTAERHLGPIQGRVNNAGITGGLARVQDVFRGSAAPGFCRECHRRHVMCA
jgi:NAD(P)-dependent dehydrogenase (short-subunit alcohol dehydrogenase family)